MELRDFLAWVISGGGGGVVTYWLLENLEALQGLAPRSKRYVSLVFPALLAGVAYLILVWLGVADIPRDTQDWFETLFYIMTGPIVAQFTHARKLAK
jgi:hypothetical protein